MSAIYLPPEGATLFDAAGATPASPEDATALRRAIRAAMARKGATVASLARDLEVHRVTLSRALGASGSGGGLTLARVAAIARALGTTLPRLLADARAIRHEAAGAPPETWGQNNQAAMGGAA